MTSWLLGSRAETQRKGGLRAWSVNEPLLSPESVVNPPESSEAEAGERRGLYWPGCVMNCWVLSHNLRDCRDPPLDPPWDTRPACCRSCDDPTDVCCCSGCSGMSLWAPLQLDAPTKLPGTVSGVSGAAGGRGSTHKVCGTDTTALHAVQHWGWPKDLTL